MTKASAGSRGGGSKKKKASSLPPRSSSKKGKASTSSTPSTTANPPTAAANPPPEANPPPSTENPPPSVEVPGVQKKIDKGKGKKSKSKWWIPYNRVLVDDYPYGKCKRCGTLIKAHSTFNGTSGLKSHHLMCERKAKEASGQSVLNYQPGTESGVGEVGSLTPWKFDQNKSRHALAMMIILDELLFRFFEREGFRRFMATAQPLFVIPGRQTIRSDCYVIFLEKKEILIEFFNSKCKGRISITTDTW
ncbi:unnamed protein product, partial [Linum tenue]